MIPSKIMSRLAQTINMHMHYYTGTGLIANALLRPGVDPGGGHGGQKTPPSGIILEKPK